MMLVEQTTVPQSALPVAQFKDHLRLGSGFSDEDLQDIILEAALRSSMAAIEARTGKALIARSFVWSVTGWRDSCRQILPISPVSAVSAVRLVARNGTEILWPATAWHLEPDTHRPVLVADSSALPTVPSAGSVQIEMLAGYGPNWDNLPDDLAHAVIMLAAHFYEYRYDMNGGASTLPGGVASLIAPYRQMRIGGGRS